MTSGAIYRYVHVLIMQYGNKLVLVSVMIAEQCHTSLVQVGRRAHNIDN
jgi:hypothetical protein